MSRRIVLKFILLCFLKKHRTFLACLFSFCLGCVTTLKFMSYEIEEYPRFVNYVNEDSRTGSLNNVTEYAVIILTALDNFQSRSAIRQTWKKFIHNYQVVDDEKVYDWNPSAFSLKNDHPFIKFYFVVGIKGLDKTDTTNLYEERKKYDDLIILENYLDEYRTLALKMLHTIRWINANLDSVKYIIKCDDDSFLRIDLIIKELEEYAPTMNSPDLERFVSFKPQKRIRGLYWGYFDGRAKIISNGKWQETKWFLCNRYLPYALGGGYVLSYDIIEYIAKNSEYLSTYNSEDVSMGVWTAALEGINRVHDIRFDTEWTPRPCNDYLLVKHKQSPQEMFVLFRNLIATKGGRLCTHYQPPAHYHYEYMYNWNVLPNSCCGRS